MELRRIKDHIDAEKELMEQCTALGVTYEKENEVESDYTRRARIKGRIKTKLKNSP